MWDNGVMSSSENMNYGRCCCKEREAQDTYAKGTRSTYNNLSNYPDVSPNASRSWYRTIDHLSKKTVSQRQIISDLEHQLKFERDKNSNLNKELQAARRQIKELEHLLLQNVAVRDSSDDELTNGVSVCTPAPPTSGAVKQEDAEPARVQKKNSGLKENDRFALDVVNAILPKLLDILTVSATQTEDFKAMKAAETELRKSQHELIETVGHLTLKACDSLEHKYDLQKHDVQELWKKIADLDEQVKNKEKNKASEDVSQLRIQESHTNIKPSVPSSLKGNHQPEPDLAYNNSSKETEVAGESGSTSDYQRRVSSRSLSPIPLQQSSLTESNMSTEEVTTSPSAHSSTTTTTTNSDVNPMLQRLEFVYKLLRRNGLTQDEIDRYEQIYGESSQILAEQPDLRQEVQHLAALSKRTKDIDSEIIERMQRDFS